jgi:WhiB family transcriptional regulator, redox-sensing transcriptional regulator
MPWARATWNGRSWRDGAACRDADAEMFFPIGSSGAALEEMAAAKAVCGCCPVQDECLSFAVTTNQEYGIWGGLDEEQRREVRRTWRREIRLQARLVG